MTESDKFLSMLGFAKRSGKIVYGYDNLRKAKNVKLLVVSISTSNLMSDMDALADKTAIPILYVAELEKIVGGNVKALGFTDANMVRAVTDYAEKSEKYRLRFGSRR